jgi:predicted RNA binding protein YcfA (HicA-like mRNA interferase family)
VLERLPMKNRDLVKRIEQDGWYWKRTSGNHRIYKHPTKSGTVVVAYHGGKDITEGTAKSVLKDAGLE